uniref:cysteine and glycine-rich protein 3-like n=1 Tax=Solea senegalensis TaxID=28829 RepID=UPI001CD89489|nr:cysteine and glycine-rich protein 3-like [Solea senegalensis]
MVAFGTSGKLCISKAGPSIAGLTVHRNSSSSSSTTPIENFTQVCVDSSLFVSSSGKCLFSTHSLISSDQQTSTEAAFQPHSRMPFGGENKCGLCQKTVYLAEEVQCEGKSWHKFCFKCVDCSKRLDSTTACTHEDELYCKSCFAKKFAPKE